MFTGILQCIIKVEQVLLDANSFQHCCFGVLLAGAGSGGFLEVEHV